MYKRPETLKVVLKRVNKSPEVIDIKHTLEDEQKLVGGLIEVVSVDENILLICNEEGKLENLQPNLIFDYDYIAGDCFFVGDDYEHGDFRSLTDEEIEEVNKICKEREFLSLIRYETLDEKEIKRWKDI